MPTQGVSLPLTPAALLRRLPRAPGVFLLDGGAADSWGSGAALLGCEPTAVVSYTPRGRAIIESASGREESDADPFELLDRLTGPTSTPARGEAPMSGVVCALGYDLGRWVERLPNQPLDDLDLPVMVAAAHPWVLAYSYGDRSYTLGSDRLSAEELAAVARRLETAALSRPSATDGACHGFPSLPDADPARLLGAAAVRERRSVPDTIHANLSHAAYLRAVERALEYIAAGDVYQVNLAQRFTADLAVAPADLFDTWLRQHPVPYAAYLDCGRFALVSNSPECFLQRDGERIATFPIKGTRPRGSTPAGDRARACELVASAKDRAEHVMIVDLERNDLGRICATGTVTVPTLAALRSFPTLHHLESTVSGVLRPDVRLSDLLRAMFPGGSITGAPKIRAMQIIDELEPIARRFYTGAMGFLVGGSWARLNIAIRTAVVTSNAVHYYAGGGIVADSIPEREYEECLLKAQTFFAAVGAA